MAHTPKALPSRETLPLHYRAHLETFTLKPNPLHPPARKRAEWALNTHPHPQPDPKHRPKMPHP